MCLWKATEPDLSKFKLLRVVVADRNPHHAFSYVAALIDPEGQLWIAERNGDDEAENYHDTNRTVVQVIENFREWVEKPALIAYGNDRFEGGVWRKESVLDGLLISHFPPGDEVSFPLTARAAVRIACLPADDVLVDLLRFATCDLIFISAFRLRGDELYIWSGGEECPLR